MEKKSRVHFCLASTISVSRGAGTGALSYNKDPNSRAQNSVDEQMVKSGPQRDVDVLGRKHGPKAGVVPEPDACQHDGQGAGSREDGLEGEMLEEGPSAALSGDTFCVVRAAAAAS